MATYTAAKAVNGNSTYYTHVAGTTITAYSTYSLTAALALNDVVEMLRVPKNARITGVALKVSDLDTGGSPAIVLNVGDTGDADRLITAATTGQAGGTTTALVSSTGQFYQYTAETVIAVTVATGPATGATTGTIELGVSYVMQ